MSDYCQKCDTIHEGYKCYLEFIKVIKNILNFDFQVSWVEKKASDIIKK